MEKEDYDDNLKVTTIKCSVEWSLYDIVDYLHSVTLFFLSQHLRKLHIETEMIELTYIKWYYGNWYTYIARKKRLRETILFSFVW